MSEKIRVACAGCEKKFACPAAAAGKKMKCPVCGTVIQVPNTCGLATPPAKPKTRRPSSRTSRKDVRESSYSKDDSDYPGEAEYDTPETLPPRSGARKISEKNTSRKKQASRSTPHWSKNMKVGIGVIVASMCSTAVQTTINGPPNTRTAAGKGQAVGQLVVLLLGVVFGIVVLVRAIKAGSGNK